MIGALGLTASAAAAYYVAAGALDRRAITLWIANWVFSAAQIQFVQLRIHAAKLQAGPQRISAGSRMLVGEFLLVAILLTFWLRGEVPLLVPIAFLPLLVRTAAWFFRRPEPLRLRRLGFTELANALVFGGLLSIAYCRL